MTDLREAYLVTGVRTPIGRYGGALATVRPDDLAAHVIRALTERLPTVDWAAIDDVVLGCANQAGEDNRNVARMATLLADLPETVSASTVNRLCGSGLDAMAIGARAIRIHSRIHEYRVIAHRLAPLCGYDTYQPNLGVRNHVAITQRG